jgi:hypothetical protein
MMKPFFIGALAVFLGLQLFLVGTFGSDMVMFISGMGPSPTGGSIPLWKYLIPSSYRFVFAALAVFLASYLTRRISRGISAGHIAAIICGFLIVFLEIGGQMELKDRVPFLWKTIYLVSLVVAFASGAVLAARFTGNARPAIQ